MCLCYLQDKINKTSERKKKLPNVKKYILSELVDLSWNHKCIKCVYVHVWLKVTNIYIYVMKLDITYQPTCNNFLRLLLIFTKLKSKYHTSFYEGYVSVVWLLNHHVTNLW